MYTTESLKKVVPMAEIAPYYHPERFMQMCQDCPHYNTVWSCPPYSFAPDELLAPYTHAMIVCFKVEFDDQAFNYYRNADEIVKLLQRLQKETKCRSDALMRELERNYADGWALLSGCCRHCEYCSRSLGLPCRDKSFLRPSLESLGYDVCGITKHVLGFPLLWYQNRLPAYLTLISALLLKEAV